MDGDRGSECKLVTDTVSINAIKILSLLRLFLLVASFRDAFLLMAPMINKRIK